MLIKLLLHALMSCNTGMMCSVKQTNTGSHLFGVFTGHSSQVTFSKDSKLDPCKL